MEDARILLENGSDGLAFGFLAADKRVNGERTGAMAALAHRYGAEAVFHRAFDCTPDPWEAAEELIRLGIDRILTSGQRERAEEGRELLGQLKARYGDRIQILAGSGVNAENAGALMAAAGLDQVHSSCRCWRRDRTARGGQVSFAFAPPPHEEEYDAVDGELVRRLIGRVSERREM